MYIRPLDVVALLALSAPAAAQAFNIDVGVSGSANGGNVPSATYGAAAGQAGQWMEFDAQPLAGLSTYISNPLTDINGVATGVIVTFDTVNGVDTFVVLDADEPTCMGDDAELMENIMYCAGAPYTATFSGLTAGSYDVYTYAMAPDSGALISLIDVPAGTGGPQTVGGAFPASGHVQGISYSLHTVTVMTGGDLVVLLDQDLNSDDSLNGFQIVPGNGGGLGVNYCGPGAPNSTGMPGIMGLSGSVIAADANLTAHASQMPNGEFAYFIASRTQGFVANPGGSQGNLCVLGSIARFNRAGEVGAVAGGQFSLQLPMGDFPEPPSGSVAVLAGDTWNFQCWHRDLLNGVPTSNFTDATELTFQ
ncbi:MAG: hypothetical protein ACI9HE_003277 [Planctomycetota bacterium]|jgi:hypothetical protein